MTKVVSGFPGVGKSFVFKQAREHDWRLLDSDSSTFSWVKEGIRNPDFPDNYMRYISGNIGFAKYIFISSHDVVRRALEESNINYTLVYPDVSLKDEYIQRYKDRNNSKPFIDFISEHWEEFILDIEKETFPTLVKLYSNQFLKDVLETI